MTPILDVVNVSKSFGNVTAVKSASLQVMQGDIVAVRGANGAGKTVLFNCITGFEVPDGGNVHFQGRSIIGCPPDQIANLGVVRTFQNHVSVPGLTVRENIQIGVDVCARRDRCPLTEAADRLGLRRILDDEAVAMSFGIQKKVALARAVVSGAPLLLLDEPAAGLSDAEAVEMGGMIRWCVDTYGVTVVVIEHNVSFVQQVASRVVEMSLGVLPCWGS